MTLGQRIKKLRNEKGLTQKDLADKYHVTYQAVSKWENGKSKPNIDELKKLADLYDVSINDLIDNIEDTKDVKYLRLF